MYSLINGRNAGKFRICGEICTNHRPYYINYKHLQTKSKNSTISLLIVVQKKSTPFWIRNRMGFKTSTLRTFLNVNIWSYFVSKVYGLLFSDFFWTLVSNLAANEFIGGQAMIIFEAYRSKMKIQQ